MVNSLENFSRGIAVEVGSIDRELKKLWEISGGVATRASLINLAVYSEDPECMNANTALIAEITRDHACRAILITADPNTNSDEVKAWISAHCHISRAGAKQVCSEQLTFLLKGNSPRLIPSIVFSHLDSDLPLYFWWQGEFHDPINDQLWSWVDRLLFDSHSWANPKEQFRLLRQSLAETKPRLTLCDLNWTRLFYLRLALAQIFDLPEALRHLPHLESGMIAYAPGYRSTALLFAGWWMAKLQWTLEKLEKCKMVFLKPNGKTVQLELKEQEGAPVNECHLSGDGVHFHLVHPKSSDFLQARICLHGDHELQHLFPAGTNNNVDLIKEELMLGSKHSVYLQSLALTEHLLG